MHPSFFVYSFFQFILVGFLIFLLVHLCFQMRLVFSVYTLIIIYESPTSTCFILENTTFALMLPSVKFLYFRILSASALESSSSSLLLKILVGSGKMDFLNKSHHNSYPYSGSSYVCYSRWKKIYATFLRYDRFILWHIFKLMRNFSENYFIYKQ